MVDLKEQTSSFWKAEANEDKETIEKANSEIYLLKQKLDKQARLLDSITPEILVQLTTSRKKINGVIENERNH